MPMEKMSHNVKRVNKNYTRTNVRFIFVGERGGGRCVG